ncbi:uncharacterized protein LOC111696660 isoform X4 [Eurytemora carolleeae]|nr:uncharacterized protein LOC111696660 isoform X4 [Eurytemora carolleeae]|eukprot:XP_023322110.1 uncharacterized protein LOC111696660 isoform X4 [Eurytemora affinis]
MGQIDSKEFMAGSYKTLRSTYSQNRAKEKLDDPLPEDEQDGTEKITVFQNNIETTGKRHFNKLEREQHAATRPPFNNRDHEEKSEFQDRRFCSIFRSLNIKGKVWGRPVDLPSCYHGWIRKPKVEQLLKQGPDGFYLLKNSTEFPGDLTLCVWQEDKVKYFRILRISNHKLTIDHKTYFQNLDDLLFEYKRTDTLGVRLVLPCLKEFPNQKNSGLQGTCRTGRYSAQQIKENAGTTGRVKLRTN